MAARKRVLNAAMQSDAATTRTALLSWARAVGLRPPSIESVARNFPDLSPELAALEQYLYAGGRPWTGSAFHTRFAAIQLESNSRKTTESPVSGLPPLHPGSIG